MHAAPCVSRPAADAASRVAVLQAMAHKSVVDELATVMVTAGAAGAGGDLAAPDSVGMEHDQLQSARSVSWARDREFGRIVRRRQLRAKADGFLMKFRGADGRPLDGADAVAGEVVPEEKSEERRARERAERARSAAEATREVVLAVDRAVATAALSEDPHNVFALHDFEVISARARAHAEGVEAKEAPARPQWEAGDDMVVSQCRYFVATKPGTAPGPSNEHAGDALPERAVAYSRSGRFGRLHVRHPASFPAWGSVDDDTGAGAASVPDNNAEHHLPLSRPDRGNNQEEDPPATSMSIHDSRHHPVLLEP